MCLYIIGVLLVMLLVSFNIFRLHYISGHKVSLHFNFKQSVHEKYKRLIKCLRNLFPTGLVANTLYSNLHIPTDFQSWTTSEAQKHLVCLLCYHVLHFIWISALFSRLVYCEHVSVCVCCSLLLRD